MPDQYKAYSISIVYINGLVLFSTRGFPCVWGQVRTRWVADSCNATQNSANTVGCQVDVDMTYMLMYFVIGNGYVKLARNWFAGYRKKHDDVIKLKPFPRYWPFVWGIYRSPVNSPHKGQRSGTLIFPWSAPWINDWINNHETGDLRRHHAHYGVIVMSWVNIFNKLLYCCQGCNYGQRCIHELIFKMAGLYYKTNNQHSTGVINQQQWLLWFHWHWESNSSARWT